MGLWDRLTNQFIDIIEWLDDSPNTMVYRFPRDDNEIKYGAKLIVRESQQAVFVNEGQIADVFPPGTYELETQNLPILTNLKNWKHGFESPFKAEVYFISTKRFADLKWGTKNPIIVRDSEFGAVRLRAFGTYEVRVASGASFLKEIVGTKGRFSSGEITDQLRHIIVSRFTDVIGERQIPVLDLAANYDEMGDFMRDTIGIDFAEYGLDLLKVYVENVSLPPEVEKVLDKRTSMGILGDLNRYTQFQAANAMETAAKTGGAASEGMGMGMGFAMANQFGKQMAGSQTPDAAGPPPLPAQTQYYVGIDGNRNGPYDLSTLQSQINAGRITRDTLVWKAGMANWSKAADVSELGGLFTNEPPPLPPSS